MPLGITTKVVSRIRALKHFTVTPFGIQPKNLLTYLNYTVNSRKTSQLIKKLISKCSAKLLTWVFLKKKFCQCNKCSSNVIGIRTVNYKIRLFQALSFVNYQILNHLRKFEVLILGPTSLTTCMPTVLGYFTMFCSFFFCS